MNLVLLYKVSYVDHGEVRESENGYYLRKRIWVWLLAFPLFMLYYLAYCAYGFFHDLTIFDAHWIGMSKRKLSFKQRIAIIYRLTN